jgi:ArsR family transcriptional regulator
MGSSLYWAVDGGLQAFIAHVAVEVLAGACARRGSGATPTACRRRPPAVCRHIRLSEYSIRACYICQDEYRSRKVPQVQAARLGNMEQLFKAMADQTRLRILALLAGGEVCVCDIHETLGIPQPRASRHLAYLRRAGLVLDRKDGLWVHYRLADPDDPVLKTLLSGVVHCLGHVSGVTHRARDEQPELPCCGGLRSRR